MNNVITGIQEFRLKLYPQDINRSRDFYENFLGLKVVREWDRGSDDQGVMFLVGTTILELLSPESEYRKLQGFGLSLEVQDAINLWGKMKDSSTVIFELRHNAWGDTSFCISDPEGVDITFFTRD